MERFGELSALHEARARARIISVSRRVDHARPLNNEILPDAVATVSNV
jgi:hypothetical protein